MAERSRPTISDVAVAAGVSPTTVSHALNGLGKISSSTREHVRRVADEIGYRPSPRAQALRRGRSRTLAVASAMSWAVAGGPSRLGFFMEVAAAAAERALTHGYALVLAPPGESGPTSVLDTVSLDGLLVVEPAADDEVVRFARDRSIPFVTLGVPPGNVDGEEGGDLAVDLGSDTVADLLVSHLVDQQVRRPVLMIGDHDRTSYRAVEARYRSEAAARDWPVVVRTVSESGGEEAAREVLGDLLEQGVELDAVVAFVDAFATGAVAELSARGLRVPDDVAVVTRYDGVRARSSTPPLTAINLELGAAAARAVDLLIARLESTTPSAPEPIAPTLVVRSSSVRA